jgi:hypothetical protein
LCAPSKRHGAPGAVPSRRGIRRAGGALGLLVLAVAGAGCPCIRDTVNASPGLRWWLFSNFGASKICPELIKKGVGLRLQERAAAVGRFFPNQCSVDVNEEKETIVVSFSGTGYAFTPLTRRVGFSTVASVEYRPDFYMGEDDMYVWGKVNGIVNGPSFKLGYVENIIANTATSMTPLGTIANLFGNQIVSGELTRGFTVVRNDETGDDFAMGILMPPQKPHHPFDVSQSEFYTFANESVEVHANQMDFLGPFEVVEAGQTLTLKYSLVGPAVDVLVVDKITGDAWRETYQTGRPLGAPPGPILAGAPLQPGPDVRQNYQLAPGQYYVVIDNSPFVGTVAPIVFAITPLTDPTAQLTYVAQLAE